MSVNVKPVEQLEFRGVFTAGNPVQRPRNTAEVCENFRVMPGNYLRLRSGRRARYNTTGTIQQICPFRTVDKPGNDMQLAQVNFGGFAAWHWFSLVDYHLSPPATPGATQIEPIYTSLDNGFAFNNPAASTNLDDRPVFYNGLGIRDGQSSQPALSHYLNGGARYFGLDAYQPSTLVKATHTPGDGGTNQWLTSGSIYIGLWHRPTNHFSNGVLIKNFPDPTPLGTIRLSELYRLSYATHGAEETAELFYVFYATIDGGQIPYLILNQGLNDPYSVPVTTTTTTLSITNYPLIDINGWHLDLASEMPTDNFPPRPMRSLTFVGGRLYGVLNPGGSGGGDWHGTYFDYTPRPRDLAAVCWSAAASDSVDTQFVGDPLQSWPLFNLIYTPSGDQPVIVAPSDQESAAVLVVTPTSTFYLQEQADGVHEWTPVSRIHGIGKASTLRVTDYGIAWVTQRNQIVLLRPGATKLQILSNEYANLMVGVPRCADYILDPVAMTDRYQVWFDTGRSVCHDFLVDGAGQGYVCLNHDFTAAASPIDSSGHTHHILAKGGLYTHEVQPDGSVLVTDQTFRNAVDQTLDYTEINGHYVRNWDDFGDSDVRKELPMVDTIGDQSVVVSWYGDFEQVIPANKRPTDRSHLTQSLTNSTMRHKTTAGHRFWFKFVFDLAGHSTDNGGLGSSYPEIASDGNNAVNFYGSVLRLLWRLGNSENRA